MNKPIPAALKKVGDIVKHLDGQKMAAAKASNPQICSARSVRFDLPDRAAKDGINRIKITNMGDGTFRVQFLKVEEIDLVGGVPPERLSEVIKQFTGVEV